MGFNFYIRLMLYTYIGIYTYIRKVVVAISLRCHLDSMRRIHAWPCQRQHELCIPFGVALS